MTGKDREGILRRVKIEQCSQSAPDSCGCSEHSEHWRVSGLNGASVSHIHMNTARHARVEAANNTHDVYSFELVFTVLLEDGSALYSVFVWTRSSVHVARTCIPGSRRIGMVIGDSSIANHHVMR